MGVIPYICLGNLQMGTFRDTWVEKNHTMVSFRPFNKIFGGEVIAGPFPLDSLYSYYRPTGSEESGTFTEVKVVIAGKDGKSPFLDAFLAGKINPLLVKSLQAAKEHIATQNAAYRAAELQKRRELELKLAEAKQALKDRQENRNERRMEESY